MAGINAYTRRPLTEEEVYQFRLILCDNEIDRDLECFTNETLAELAPLFLGKTGVFDHNAKAENQTARIYHTEVVTDPSKKTSYGQPYCCLQAKAYLVRCDKNQDLIEEIDGGIKKEVSIGCSVADITCSVCGASHRNGGCDHQMGQTYGNVLCYHKLEHPTDAYEWSFVAVPAQRQAGVIKQYQRDLKTLKKSVLNEDTVTLTGGELQQLKGYLSSLEEELSQAKEYRVQLSERVVKLACLCGDTLPVSMLASLTDKMNLTELKAFEQSYEDRLNQSVEGPQLVTGQVLPPKQDVNNQSFKV